MFWRNRVVARVHGGSARTEVDGDAELDLNEVIALTEVVLDISGSAEDEDKINNPIVLPNIEVKTVLVTVEDNNDVAVTSEAGLIDTPESCPGPLLSYVTGKPIKRKQNTLFSL
jgi:hypothetical protein